MDLSFRVSLVQRRTPGPRGPAYCYHKFLSNNEQRRVMEKHGGQMGDKQCATPMGHSCPTKSKWTSPRDWTFPPRESGPLPGRPASIHQEWQVSQAIPSTVQGTSSEIHLFWSIRTCLSQLCERKTLLQKKCNHLKVKQTNVMKDF